MRVTLTMTDGTEQTLYLPLAEYRRLSDDTLLGDEVTWGQYRDVDGQVHHLEFDLIARFSVRADVPREGQLAWNL